MSINSSVIDAKSKVERAPLPSTDSDSAAVGTAKLTLSNRGTLHLKLKAASCAITLNKIFNTNEFPSSEFKVFNNNGDEVDVASFAAISEGYGIIYNKNKYHCTNSFPAQQHGEWLCYSVCKFCCSYEN